MLLIAASAWRAAVSYMAHLHGYTEPAIVSSTDQDSNKGEHFQKRLCPGDRNNRSDPFAEVR